MLVTVQGVQKMAGLFGTVCVYLYTLQYGFKEEPAVLRDELVSAGLIDAQNNLANGGGTIP